MASQAVAEADDQLRQEQKCFLVCRRLHLRWAKMWMGSAICLRESEHVLFWQGATQICMRGFVQPMRGFGLLQDRLGLKQAAWGFHRGSKPWWALRYFGWKFLCGATISGSWGCFSCAMLGMADVLHETYQTKVRSHLSRSYIRYVKSMKLSFWLVGRWASRVSAIYFPKVRYSPSPRQTKVSCGNEVYLWRW